MQLLDGQGFPLFDAVQPAVPMPSTTSPALQGALKNAFGEVVARDLPEPCECPSLNNYQNQLHD